MILFFVVSLPHILSLLSFEYTTGMHKRLILLWDLSVPMVLALSPIIALIIMGGDNKKGLGRNSQWTDFSSLNYLSQIKTGRSYTPPKREK
ncbi:hypothetical protein WNY51_18405 [Pseudocolwellia sp. AS88]|uniref:hypothetical protein n=1 Tax=Pseudocolwellia sp. AS88 TaxID=3063958 RepID=UPI0026EE4078|nr:hypothetical protein [Pseudocolwellia sp. AS88]MDO7085556.1 hypothetical protein [Pseudocolwellia sp. AS88]